MADGNGRFKIDGRVRVTRGMNRGRTGVFVGVNDIGHPLVRFSGGLVRPFDKGSLEAAGIPPISRERLAEIRAIPDEAIDTSDIPELPSGRRVRRGPGFLEAAGDPATPEPPAPEPSIPAGTRVLVVRQLYRDGRELQGKQGVVVDVDQVPNRKGSVFVRIDGDASAHEIEPWGLEVLPARAATPEPPAPAPHKFRRGDRIRITGGEWAGREGTIQFNEPISGGDGDWFVLIDGGPDLYQAIEECHILGRSAGPEPIPSGSTPPEPTAPSPPPALSRLEYFPLSRERDQPSPLDEWRAALLPVSNPTDKDHLSFILSILVGYGALPGQPEPDIALIDILGGHPVPAHAPGDRVAITGGPWEGRTMYLSRRDEADDDSWWLAGEPGGRAWLGLRLDGFEAVGMEGGGA